MRDVLPRSYFQITQTDNKFLSTLNHHKRSQNLRVRAFFFLWREVFILMVLIAQVVAFLLFLLSFSTIESFEFGRNWWSQSVAHHSILSCLHACHLSVMFQFLSFIVPIEYPIWSLVLLYFIFLHNFNDRGSGWSSNIMAYGTFILSF